MSAFDLLKLGSQLAD